jgi:hypothetical protein
MYMVYIWHQVPDSQENILPNMAYSTYNMLQDIKMNGNGPTVVHACRKRRLKWVPGAWGYNWATQSPGDINMETCSSRLGVGAQG